MAKEELKCDAPGTAVVEFVKPAMDNYFTKVKLDMSKILVRPSLGSWGRYAGEAT